MGPIEILLGVTFPTLLAGGFALVGTGTSIPEFWIARICFVAAALDLLGILVWWLYSTGGASWKLVIAAPLGILIVVGLPETLRWIDGKEIAQRERNITRGANDIAPLVDALRASQQEVANQQQSADVVRRILAHYDQLQNSISVLEQVHGTPDVKDRIATAVHTLDELKVLLGVVQLQQMPQGRALIIKTAPNTFRVTFSTPMRVPPQLTFLNLPDGTEPNVVENSTIGFTVIFTPSTVAVEHFGFKAYADFW